MNKYIVTKTEIFEMVVHAESEDDAEYDAIMKQDFRFIDDEYSVKEVAE